MTKNTLKKGYKMKRLHLDEYFILMAKLASLRSTCIKRQVGCVFVNDKGHVLATGYNGAASGMPHCIDKGKCLRADFSSGTHLDDCMAVHAEENALIQCKNSFEIDTCYTTTFPCKRCLRMLLNTSCKRIVYIEDYADSVKEWPRMSYRLDPKECIL